jgi:hypothetical protein
MEITAVRPKDEAVKTVLSPAVPLEDKQLTPFSKDKNQINKTDPVKPEPFIQINPKASFSEITFVSESIVRGMGTAVPPKENNNLTPEIFNKLFKPLPVTDRGLDDDSDEYLFAAYPKSNKKYQLGPVKAKMESFQSITGLDKGTFRILYGSTTGDKKFNFDGAAIGLEVEARQNSYLVNHQPEISLPVDNNSNYFFEQRNLAVDHSHGSITGVFALEGIKIGVKYEKNQPIGISNVEFHEGGLTTNLIDFAKKYPYIAIPVATVIAGGAVAGSYFMTKKTGPMNINGANIVVYRYDEGKNNIRVGISPSLTVDGSEQFIHAFKMPGGAASVQYRYDDNLAITLNGGYNIVDGLHAFAASSMRF